MIYSGRIIKTLSFLESEYQKSLTHSDEIRSVLFAKLALLEYCGWIESAFDDIARNCVRHRLRTLASRKLLEDKIKGTHGFTYTNNTRPLLTFALGTIKLLEIEKELESDGSLDRLNGVLGSLNQLRKEAAHTFTCATHTFHSPGYFIGSHRQLEPILKRLWEKVRCE